MDMDASVTGATCTNCGEWFQFALKLQTVKRDHNLGEKSPVWEHAIKLANWVPPGLTPSMAASLLYGVDTEYTKTDDGAPFLSEAYLYNVFGKEDARTLLALISRILEASGATLWEVQKAAAKARREERECQEH